MSDRQLRDLVEARIREARARGAFDRLEGAGKPLPDDPLASLPAETRVEARIVRASGETPREVVLAATAAKLRQEIATETEPRIRRELAKELRDVEMELHIRLEATGRAVLVGKL